MTGILTAGRDRADNLDRARTFDRLTTLAAAVALLASTTANVLQQSSVDQDHRDAGRSATETSAPFAIAKETMVAAYTGAPYTYPSSVRIGKPHGAQDFIIDRAHWYTNPFHNPIYYGARVVRWSSGGTTGMMLDFTHSKAIADRGQEASFSGTINGKPAPPRARIGELMKHLEFTHGHNMLTLNGLLRLPSLHPRVSPYIGAGAGILLPHTQVEIANGEHRTYEYNYAGPVGQALFGVELRLARTSFFVEYKFTYAQYEAPLSQMDGSWLFLDIWRQIRRWIDGEEPPGGHVSTDIASHQVISGLAVRFAAAPSAP
jgi:hypothetical protein